MTEIADQQRAYAKAGPWDRLGGMLRVFVAVLFVVITAAFLATAQDGLISAGDIGSATSNVPSAGAAGK